MSLITYRSKDKMLLLGFRLGLSENRKLIESVTEQPDHEGYYFFSYEREMAKKNRLWEVTIHGARPVDPFGVTAKAKVDILKEKFQRNVSIFRMATDSVMVKSIAMQHGVSVYTVSNVISELVKVISRADVFPEVHPYSDSKYWGVVFPGTKMESRYFIYGDVSIKSIREHREFWLSMLEKYLKVKA